MLIFQQIFIIINDVDFSTSRGLCMPNRFEDFTTYMLQLNRYIQKIKEIEMQKFGLHAMHTMCLYYLDKNPKGLTSGQLTKLCKEDKAAISRTLKQLIELGLVDIDKAADQKNYRCLLFLTPKGQVVCQDINLRIEEVLSLLSNGISDDERHILYKSLATIMHNFQDYLENEETK